MDVAAQAAARAELEADLEALRRHGVKFFEQLPGGLLKVEFWPPVPEAHGEPAPKLEEKCACGHATYEHNAGLCILGCDPLKCAPEKKP